MTTARTGRDDPYYQRGGLYTIRGPSKWKNQADDMCQNDKTAPQHQYRNASGIPERGFVWDTNATAPNHKAYATGSGGAGNSRRIVVVPIVTGVCGTFGSGHYPANCPANPGPDGPAFGANTVIGFASFFLLPASSYDSNAQSPICAEYIGPWGPNSMSGGAGGSGSTGASVPMLVDSGVAASSSNSPWYYLCSFPCFWESCSSDLSCASCMVVLNPAQSQFARRVGDFLVYGSPSPDGSQQPLTDGLTGANVKVSLQVVNNFPVGVLVGIVNYGMPAPTGQVTLTDKPQTQFPDFGRVAVH